ncbi:MAG TPA: ferredoxin-thioredoxin reductase catalytic domain-containing protein [Methanobacterium sp.]
MNQGEVDDARVDEFYKTLKKQVEEVGYHLNPDTEFTKSLLKSILVNEDRYGYEACPCRLASGNKEEDLDIICPCYYRDPDLEEYDACYCGLYISGDILSGEKELTCIPERRPAPDEWEKIIESSKETKTISNLPLPVWRCRVCGYLCAREEPPESCPICKADKERFERFI